MDFVLFWHNFGRRVGSEGTFSFLAGPWGCQGGSRGEKGAKMKPKGDQKGAKREPQLSPNGVQNVGKNSIMIYFY